MQGEFVVVLEVVVHGHGNEEHVQGTAVQVQKLLRLCMDDEALVAVKRTRWPKPESGPVWHVMPPHAMLGQSRFLPCCGEPYVQDVTTCTTLPEKVTCKGQPEPEKKESENKFKGLMCTKHGMPLLESGLCSVCESVQPGGAHFQPPVVVPGRRITIENYCPAKDRRPCTPNSRGVCKACGELVSF